MIAEYFTDLRNMSDTLKSICNQGINQEMLTINEINFLQSMIYRNGNGGSGDTSIYGLVPKIVL